jgi:hypothetical protein
MVVDAETGKPIEGHRFGHPASWHRDHGSLDRQWWVDYGRDGRRLQEAQLTQTGTFTVADPSPGQYHVVAFRSPDPMGDDWTAPGRLERLAQDATTVSASGPTPVPGLLKVVDLRGK